MTSWFGLFKSFKQWRNLEGDSERNEEKWSFYITWLVKSKSLTSEVDDELKLERKK